MALRIASLRQLAAPRVPAAGVDGPAPHTPSEVMALMNLQSALEELADESAAPRAPLPPPAAGAARAPEPTAPEQPAVSSGGAEFLAGPHCNPRMREGFRKLANRIEQERIVWQAAGHHLHSVAVLSPRRGDGRSVTSRNLAACLGARPSSRVLLVDADAANPSLVRRFQLQRAPGFAESLDQGGTDWLGWTTRVRDSGLHLLPHGQTRGRHGPHYGNLPAFLDQARRVFEWVIFDMPSMESADAEIVSRHADGSLVVLRGGRTCFEEAAAAVCRIPRARLLGTVLGVSL